MQSERIILKVHERNLTTFRLSYIWKNETLWKLAENALNQYRVNEGCGKLARSIERTKARGDSASDILWELRCGWAKIYGNYENWWIVLRSEAKEVDLVALANEIFWRCWTKRFEGERKEAKLDALLDETKWNGVGKTRN